MKNIRLILFALIAVIFILPTAEAITFNGREYTQIAGQWYEVYEGENFALEGTHLLVQFKSWVSEDQIDSLNQEYGGDLYMELLYDWYAIVSESPTEDPLDFCGYYLNSGFVEKIKNCCEIMFNNLPDDDLFENQINLNDEIDDGFDNDINMDLAWDIETGNPEVLIGIVDDGLLFWHPDIVDNIWQNFGEDADGDGFIIQDTLGRVYLDTMGWNGVNFRGDLDGIDNDDNEYIDDLIGISVSPHAEGWSRDRTYSYEIGLGQEGSLMCDHGTPVVSAAISKTNNNTGVAGVAGGWGCENEGCKVVFTQLYPPGNAVSAEVAHLRCLDYMISAVDIDILSSSSNPASQSDAYEQRIDSLLSLGVFVSSAAGNTEDCDSILWSARVPGTCVVGASFNDRRFVTSRYGEGLSIMAPTGYGDEAEPDTYLQWCARTVLENRIEVPSYNYFAQTSGAAPLVAGIAALLLSQARRDSTDLTNDEIFEILCTTANKDDDDAIGDTIIYVEGEDYKYGSWSQYMGYGELDAGHAVQYGRRQEIELEEGWTWISSRMVPFQTENNGLDDEDGIFLMFDELVDDLELLKNIYGKFWTPAWEYCDIPNWEPLEGYMIDLNAHSTWISLGREMPYDSTLQLGAGWNLIAYLPANYTLEAEDAFEELWILPNDTLLKIAKDYEGNFYIPSQEFNNMDALSPGYGYQLYVYDDVEYNYPEEPGGGDAIASKGTRNKIQSVPEHFQIAARTSDFYPILINTVTVEDVIPSSGDEIGVFTPDDICIGGSVFTGVLPFGIPVWEDDTLTVEIDGYRDGETFYLHYWDSDCNVEIIGDSLNIFSNLDFFDDEPGYSKFDLKIQSPTYLTPVAFSLMQNYPNPFNSTTEISYSLPKSADVCLEIYDLSGRLVTTLVNGSKEPGKYVVIWDGQNVLSYSTPSGLYFYRILAKDVDGEISKAIKRLVLIR